MQYSQNFNSNPKSTDVFRSIKIFEFLVHSSFSNNNDNKKREAASAKLFKRHFFKWKFDAKIQFGKKNSLLTFIPKFCIVLFFFFFSETHYSLPKRQNIPNEKSFDCSVWFIYTSFYFFFFFSVSYILIRFHTHACKPFCITFERQPPKIYFFLT